MKKVEKISSAMNKTYETLKANIQQSREEAQSQLSDLHLMTKEMESVLKDLDILEKQIEPLKNYVLAEKPKRTRRKKNADLQTESEKGA